MSHIEEREINNAITNKTNLDKEIKGEVENVFSFQNGIEPYSMI